MKTKFFIFLFICISTWLFAEYTVDLNFALMPENKTKTGKIQIRNINDLRKEISENQTLGLDFIGNLRNGFGIPFRCKSTVNIDVVFKNLIIESLKYAGFDASDYSQADKSPILDIDVIDCSFDGYGGFYGLGIKLDYKLSKAENNEILFEKSAIASGFLAIVWGGGTEINFRISSAYHRVLNRILKISGVVFKSQYFKDAYNGKKYEKKTEVDFTDKKLKSIPADINNKNAIEVLNFHNNKIRKIDNLSDFDSLNELDLSFNLIAEINNLDKLQNLNSLSLANNNIKTIQNLDKINSLKDLDLGNNSIDKLDNINNLENLEWLVLCSNNIGSINNLSGLANLSFLDLSYNKQITKLENFDQNKSLFWLNMNSTGIKNIENLDKLSSLIYLDLSNCKIKKIENLDNMKNLLYLNLSFNTWIEKIEGLDNLKSLKKLNLSDSIYKKIEGMDNLVSLEELNLSRNPIKKIENLDNLSNLKILNLSFTDINKLENIENLKNLKSLIISPLRIRKIKKETYDFLKSKNWNFTGVSMFSKKSMALDDFIKDYNIKIE